ncbi:MAG TPA: cell division ATP-binding protein FtsE, partial [Microbacterium sp.]|nr:cell division ATP-binding protein FtsE [Microbacterium sp.]
PAVAEAIEHAEPAVEPEAPERAEPAAEAFAATPVSEPAAPRTQPVPIADIAEVDVAELGLADRLGLGETDPDDEVGPTS